jgi:hypothetical protein
VFPALSLPRTFGLLIVAALATSALTGPAPAAFGAQSALTDLKRVSHDPYTGGGAQHATEAEPDTLNHGKTIVSVFQVGRFSDGGSVNTGWATSTDGGKHWKHGFLPGITVAEGGPYARVSDPAVAYDDKHGVWLVTGLIIDSAGRDLGVVVSSSTNGKHWNSPVLAVGNDGQSYDKEWVACDSWPSSPHYGNCYIEVDKPSSGNQIVMVTSSDGGNTWGSQKVPSGSPSGLGGQPLAQPNGNVVVPFSANYSAVQAFRSTDGGNSWMSTVTISTSNYHDVTGMRQEPLPTAEIDASGRIYVAWQDCRFRSGCSANDIVMSTSDNGTTWSSVVRIPIDPTDSGMDHFTPGLGVSTKTSGSEARLGLYYYFYPQASCSASTCQLEVGYISSNDGGTNWSSPTMLAGPMKLSWLAQAGGAMVGDYISCSIIGKKAVSVFAVGQPPNGSTLDQAMYTAGRLAVTSGGRRASSRGATSRPGALHPALPHPLS